MSKEIYISSTPHETRLAIVEDDQAAEVYYERENEYTLAGSIYKGRVTRVLPGMQSAFVDVGLERDAFLYVTDFLEEQEDSADFERIPAGGDRTAPAKENRDQRQLIVQLPEALADVENGASPASAGDTESAGNRRLRGRRGRRRGRSGERGSQSVVATPEPQGQQRREVEADYEPLSAREPQHQARFEPTVEHRSEVNRGSSNSAAPTPFVLPGESLSKYGSVPASSTSARQSAPSSPSSKPSTLTISRPSTLVDVPLTWDGGTTLPGESLSRHRGQPAQMPAHEASQAAESSIAADSAEAPAPSSPQEAAVEFGAEAAIASGADEARLFMPDTRAGSTYEPAHFEETASIHEHQHEEELSASHRVNPAAPVEFRSKWVEDASVIEAPEPPASESAHASHTHDQQPEFPRQTSQWSPENVDSHPISESAGSAETTIIEPTGDMHSLALPPQEESAADQTAEFSATAETLHSGASGIFAPGEGLVEEEIIDEEESEYEPLAIHADESEFDELEEETRESLEGGDLGDMLRDAQIEQETRYLSDDPESEDTAQVDVFDEDIDAYEADPQGTDEIDDTAEAGVASTVVRTGQPSERRPRRGGHDRRFGRNQRGGPRGRKNTQSTSLPIISELLKQGQEILVQIAKEPIARKGARITSHIALPGRYLVFMPTVNHVGVSRKISSDEERRRLKHVLLSEKGDVPGGFIVRTAAGTASEEELRADIRFLINLWADVKQRADAGKAPALIYHDLSLVERVLRDQVTESFSTIWVDTEADYERVLRFLQRFQPAMVRRVKLYTKETPLFEQFGIQDEINKALKSKVWLKSGGSIVINQTEALVAIDINTGKYVGKTARLEDTIIKTNLDAIPEIVRQIRLRDLGGIIVIDFIDMDERKNRQKVMQALEEALKADRAPSKVLQFNDFGLVAITRKRVKQSLERTLSTQCIVCTGTGMVKSPVTVCNEIYVEMRKMRNHLEGKDVLLRVHPEVVKQLKSSSGKWLNELEEVAGRTIILKSDPTLQPEQFDIH